jgi:hypothetical protein
VWDFFGTLLELLGKAEAIRNILPKWLWFSMNPAVLLCSFVIAIYFVVRHTRWYRSNFGRLKSWTRKKSMAVTLSIFVIAGAAFGVGAWAWTKYGPQPTADYSPETLAHLSNEDLQAETYTFTKQLRTLYDEYNKEWSDTDRDALQNSQKSPASRDRDERERQRQEKHEEQAKKYNGRFRRNFLQDAQALDMEMTNRLSKTTLVGPMVVPLGQAQQMGVATASHLQKPPPLITGTLGGSPDELQPLAGYLEALARLL